MNMKQYAVLFACAATITSLHSAQQAQPKEKAYVLVAPHELATSILFNMIKMKQLKAAITKSIDTSTYTASIDTEDGNAKDMDTTGLVALLKASDNAQSTKMEILKRIAGTPQDCRRLIQTLMLATMQLAEELNVDGSVFTEPLESKKQ